MISLIQRFATARSSTRGGGGGDTGCGKWDFHFNVGLTICVEIICVFHIKRFC